jgi:GTPase SAR1 family protein
MYDPPVSTICYSDKLQHIRLSIKMDPFKVVLVGDAQVGKSCYLRKIATGTFEKRYEPTIGVEVR